MKKIALFIVMLFSCIIPVQASTNASITIELQDSIDNLSKENVEFEIVQVAKYEDGYYVLNEGFQDLNVDLNKELKAEQIEELCNVIKKKSVEGVKVKTNHEGIVKISNIEKGMYFIDPIDISEYDNISSMLVSVPEWEMNELIYDVVVYPKHSPFEKFILKKVDKDTKHEILDLFEFTSYKDADCKEKIKSYKGNGTISILMRDQIMYLKETKAPKGYVLSNRVICVEMKDGALYVDGKKLDSNVFEFENKKNHVPTGIEYHGNIYVTMSLIALVIILHIINKKLRK